MSVREPILSSHEVLRTRDLDEARAAVARRYCDHKLNLTRGKRLSVRHNHARAAHISLNVLSYGGDVSINPGELKDFYLVQIPLAGAARISHRGEDIDANPACATVLNPDRPTAMEWREDCTKLMLQVDAPFLERVAAEAIGTHLPGPIRFAPRVDLTRSAGRKLKALALSVAEAVESGALCLTAQDLSLLAVERQLALSLLELQPSNVSHLLDANRRRPPAGSIRRAVHFIHASHHQDVRLEDVAKAAGLHPRTLQVAFRDAMDVSPMGYLKNVRLDRARYDLMKRRNRPSVTEVAYDCGYSHLGRFSRDFRMRFGQSPRDVGG